LKHAPWPSRIPHPVGAPPLTSLPWSEYLAIITRPVPGPTVAALSLGVQRVDRLTVKTEDPCWDGGWRSSQIEPDWLSWPHRMPGTSSFQPPLPGKRMRYRLPLGLRPRIRQYCSRAGKGILTARFWVQSALGSPSDALNRAFWIVDIDAPSASCDAVISSSSKLQSILFKC